MARASGEALDRFEFEGRLRALDADAFEAFVADCWRARGWTVERRGSHLVVTHPELGDRRTLTVHAVPWWRPGTPSEVPRGDADLVVLNRQIAGDDRSAIGTTGLYEMARYSVDATGRAGLFGEHLDRQASLPGRFVRRVPAGALHRYVPAVVALTILLASVAAGVVLLPADGPDADLTEANVNVPPADAGAERVTPSEYAATRWPGNAGGYPPGLEHDGVTDPEALASTHASRVSRRSSELTLTVREYEDGRRVGSYRERIAVRDDWTFVSSIERSGELQSDYPTVAAVEMYSGGNVAYVHAPAGWTMGRQEILLASPGDVAGIHDRVEQFIADVLATDDSAVVETHRIGDATLHLVEGTRRMAGGGTENVTALVTAGGTVRSVHVQRDVPGSNASGPNRTVLVSVRYLFGPVVVDPPAWVRNESVTIGRGFPTSKR